MTDQIAAAAARHLTTTVVPILNVVCLCDKEVPKRRCDSTATATLSTIYSRLGLPFDTLRYKIIFRATNTCRGFIKSSFLYKGEEQGGGEESQSQIQRNRHRGGSAEEESVTEQQQLNQPTSQTEYSSHVAMTTSR